MLVMLVAWLLNCKLAVSWQEHVAPLRWILTVKIKVATTIFDPPPFTLAECPVLGKVYLNHSV